MIFYDYKCYKCSYDFERRLPSENRHEPEEEPCPSCGAYEVKLQVGSPQYRDPATMGIKKPDEEFRDLLKKIKKDYRGSGNIDRYT